MSAIIICLIKTNEQTIKKYENDLFEKKSFSCNYELLKDLIMIVYINFWEYLEY